MLLFYERRKIIFIVCILAIIILGCSCNNSILTQGEEKRLTVNYIDVGYGDCTLITLPDGKSMLIDTGSNNVANKQTVLDKLQRYTNKIDYLVLTNLNNEHISNAKNVIENFKIGVAFIPYIIDRSPYLTFDNIYKKLVEKEVDIRISQSYLNLSTKDYSLVFLSPMSNGERSSYTQFNNSPIKTQSLINNLSPVIYLEYKGVRFLFTGDGEKSQEEILLDCYRLGLYDGVIGNNRRVKLEDIDFYKLSNHGSSLANSIEFLHLIKPQNAIISVGKGGNQNYPSTQTLNLLTVVNENYNLYRTDRDKTVRVEVNNFGKYQVFKGE